MRHLIQYFTKYIDFVSFYWTEMVGIFVVVVFFMGIYSAIFSNNTPKQKVVEINGEKDMNRYRALFGIKPRRRWKIFH
jgi:hypothetical protein